MQVAANIAPPRAPVLPAENDELPSSKGSNPKVSLGGGGPGTALPADWFSSVTGIVRTCEPQGPECASNNRHSTDQVHTWGLES